MEKFKDRKEQRQVTEVMNGLLLPTLNYLNADTAIKVRRALYLLGEIEVEPQESEELCDSCINNGCIFQSGIVRNHCDFYKAESEDKG